MIKNKNIIFIGEFLGSCFLVMIIVGSGIMAENLTDDNAVRLLANTIATGAGLFVLIISLADISGYIVIINVCSCCSVCTGFHLILFLCRGTT